MYIESDFFEDKRWVRVHICSFTNHYTCPALIAIDCPFGKTKRLATVLPVYPIPRPLMDERDIRGWYPIVSVLLSFNITLPPSHPSIPRIVGHPMVFLSTTLCPTCPAIEFQIIIIAQGPGIYDCSRQTSSLSYNLRLRSVYCRKSLAPVP